VCVKIQSQIREAVIIFFHHSPPTSFQALFEYMRVTKIAPLGPLLDKAFGLYLDEKDGGTLILSNIYLLAGGSIF
jgi:hypothetical protein